MLSSPELPALVRTKVIEYIAEKAVGRYGHKRTQARRFFRHVEMGVMREDLPRSALRTNCERSGTSREGQSGSLGDSTNGTYPTTAPLLIKTHSKKPQVLP
jgi:hypothetical protein